MAWSAVLVALQLLLILVPFALILLAPTLVPTLPKLGSHPTTSSKVYHPAICQQSCEMHSVPRLPCTFADLFISTCS